MDLSLLSTVFSVVAIVATGMVAIVVGRKRGVSQVEARLDSELAKTVAAQAARLAVLEAENSRLSAEVAALQTRVANLTMELHESDAALRKAIAHPVSGGA